MSHATLAVPSHLTDTHLLRATSRLASSARETCARLVLHLAEVQRRGLHLAAGCANLFSYCRERLGLSEGAAATRVRVARLCLRLPVSPATRVSGYRAPFNTSPTGGSIWPASHCLHPTSPKPTSGRCSSRPKARANGRLLGWSPSSRQNRRSKPRSVDARCGHVRRARTHWEARPSDRWKTRPTARGSGGPLQRRGGDRHRGTNTGRPTALEPLRPALGAARRARRYPGPSRLR